MTHNIKGNDLRKLGFPEGKAIGAALVQLARKENKNVKPAELLAQLKAVLDDPASFMTDLQWSHTAAALIPPAKRHIELAARKPYKVWNEAGIEPIAKNQMDTCMKLPITVAGALMGDSHLGYGMPIGGVVATDNAVVPTMVGNDIGCRMALSVFPIEASYMAQRTQEFKSHLLECSRFGGRFEKFKKALDHPVLSRDEFKSVPFLKNKFQTALAQIGTSGGGNHFVEFGHVTITDPNNALGLPIGEYVGLLTHSGSRGLGASIANHYTKLAMEQCMLPDLAKDLAWLNLDTELGQEYWAGMNLSGDYASACHEQIHARISKAIGARPIATVENHHNFAWKEVHGGREVVVHRKGATPAGQGVLGIIPGSMSSSCFIVSGKGVAESLNSASHGAGRLMSRTAAKNMVSESDMRKRLADMGIELIGGGPDECIDAYKPIAEVMAAQADLVDVLGTFMPRIVRMEGASEAFSKPWENRKKKDPDAGE